ncbi:MAG: M48 family metallopeptidase [Bacteroidetes bacterium]|nr:M48 family metallopeptidase [Bacteroidota bacterium]HET6245885.1 SprT family zinc-dependent metalloprotease [Bacteroidia bacterium]
MLEQRTNFEFSNCELSIEYGTTTIKFKVHYSDRKTLGIEVHPDQSIKVIAPTGLTLNRIMQKVENKAPWIQKQVRKFSRIEKFETKKDYVSGETMFYLGRQYRLKVIKGDPSVKLSGKYFWLSMPDKNDKILAAELIEQWYKEHAIKKLNDRFIKLNHIAKHEKIKVNTLYFRTLKKRWGSCTKLGNITLNINLIKAPIDCIDYVIIHELCHLKYLNHSPKFYRLLDKYSPDWRIKQEKLNRF